MDPLSRKMHILTLCEISTHFFSSGVTDSPQAHAKTLRIRTLGIHGLYALVCYYTNAHMDLSVSMLSTLFLRDNTCRHKNQTAINSYNPYSL